MFRKSLILVSFLFVLALAIIGCGGGGGGGTTGNPVGPVATPGATANLSGTVLFDNTPTPFAAVHLYKSEKAHTFGMAQLPSLKGSLVAQQIIGDGAYSTTTSAEGVYNFTDIPVGQYTLIAMRDDNHQFVQTGVLLGQVTTINPQLTPTGKITGKVTLSIGGTPQAIAGAFVYINGTSYIAVSDNAGNFTINNVPSNALTTSTAYEILVSSTRGTAAPVTGVVVNPGATRDVGTIAMTAPAQAGYATLNGSLVAGQGISDVSGIFVILTHKTSGTIFGTHTDATGKFQFRVMETGDFLVLCPEGDYTFTPNTLTINVAGLTTQALTLTPIIVDADQVEATGSITGTVTHMGTPFAGAIINVTGTSLLGISDSSGNFIINKVPVNSSTNPYTLELSSSKGTATRKFDVIVSLGQATAVGDFAITVPTTGYKNIVGKLTITPPPMPSEGSLPMPSPSLSPGDLSNRLIQLSLSDGRVISAFTDISGNYSFMATQSGPATVSVIDSAFIYTPRNQPVMIEVPDNGAIPQVVPDILVSEPATGELKYRVDGMVNKLVFIKPETDHSGVNIKFTPEAAMPSLYALSNYDGSFSIMAAPGTYTLTVEGAYTIALSPIIVEITGPYMFPPPAIDVKPVTTVNSIVEGTVTWTNPPGGWMMTDGEVILENQAGTPAFSERRLVSASTGFFRFDSVPPGSYIATISRLNGYSGQASVSIIEGQDLTVANTTAINISATFYAPFINATTVSGNVMAISGLNFELDDTMMQAFVNGVALPSAGGWVAGESYFNISSLAPGQYSVQLVKNSDSYGNKYVFTREVQAPLLANFTASSTDTSITCTWQNAPYVTAVDVRLLQGAAVVKPLQRIIGNSVTYNSLQASTTYIIEVTSTYPNVSNSAPTPFSFSTKKFGPQKPGLMTLAGSSSINGTIFGFEMMNDKTYVAYYEGTGGGTVYIQAFGADGAPIGAVYATPYMITSAFDFCAGNGSLYVLCPNSSYQLEIQRLIPLADGSIPASPAATTALTGFLSNEPNQAKIEFHGNNLFVSTRAEVSATNVLNVTRLSSTLTTPTNIYSSSNNLLVSALPGNWVQTAAEGIDGIYVAVATSPTPLLSVSPSQFEILYALAGASATQQVALINVPSLVSMISEFKANGPELIINSGLSVSDYLSVNRSNGVIVPLSYIASLEGFGTDHQGRLWGFLTGDAYSLVNLVNGQITNTFSVSGVPGGSREFIKRQIGGTIMPNKFGMLHKKFDGNLGVFYYDGSM
ncbi:MAG: hypothetical protein CVV41_02220 [Candidatus Riflebacteria bacterium HGW-Riflebacteria-1]|jgi:hypothetical protein|nr:MAG: hypothetical protein CVV41_02220 [Candidatus Riflebacteria bacterium HGW-Riflebacteria-1]